MSYLSGKFWDWHPRYCEQHRGKAPAQGGEFVKTDENHQVWICKECLKRKEEKNDKLSTSV